MWILLEIKCSLKKKKQKKTCDRVFPMLGVDFPAQHDHPVLTPYCELHAAMFFPELLMYYSLLVYLWFKCWGWLFLGLSKKLSKVQEGGQEISRLWDTFFPQPLKQQSGASTKGLQGLFNNNQPAQVPTTFFLWGISNRCHANQH